MDFGYWPKAYWTGYWYSRYWQLFTVPVVSFINKMKRISRNRKTL